MSVRVTFPWDHLHNTPGQTRGWLKSVCLCTKGWSWMAPSSVWPPVSSVFYTLVHKLKLVTISQDLQVIFTAHLVQRYLIWIFLFVLHHQITSPFCEPVYFYSTDWYYEGNNRLPLFLIDCVTRVYFIDQSVLQNARCLVYKAHLNQVIKFNKAASYLFFS